MPQVQKLSMPSEDAPLTTLLPVSKREESNSLAPRRHTNFAILNPSSRLREFQRSLTTLPPAIREATIMVTHWEVGVQASLFALLHEVYTGTIVPVYDGSLMEWSLQPDLPVETSRRASEGRLFPQVRTP